MDQDDDILAEIRRRMVAEYQETIPFVPGTLADARWNAAAAQTADMERRAKPRSNAARAVLVGPFSQCAGVVPDALVDAVARWLTVSPEL